MKHQINKGVLVELKESSPRKGYVFFKEKLKRGWLYSIQFENEPIKKYYSEQIKYIDGKEPFHQNDSELKAVIEAFLNM